MFGSRRRRRRKADPASLEHADTWGVRFLLEASEQAYLDKLNFSQLVHLYPESNGDKGFTPSSAEWDEILRRLQSLLVGRGEERGESVYHRGGDFHRPYEGVVLEDPFNRTDRTPPPEARLDRTLIFQPDDRFFVHHGWVTHARSGGAPRRWWRDADRAFEKYLLELVEKYGMGEELRRRRAKLP